MVHNEFMKSLFVASGFVTEERVSVVGVPRMDNLCQLISRNQKQFHDEYFKQIGSKKLVLLAYFPPGQVQKGFFDDYGLWRPPGVPNELFEDVIRVIVELSISHPDVEFLVKPKKGDESIKYFYSFLREQEYDMSSIGNLKINDEINIHNAIMRSTVVCGLQTTAVLEAAVAKKEVIVPYFENYHDSEWSERFGYRDYLDLFTVPRDAIEFKRSVESGLCEIQQEESVMAKRRELFQHWVSDLDGNSTKKCLNLIRNIVKDQQIWNDPCLHKIV
jgi:hypothetical protein